MAIYIIVASISCFLMYFGQRIIQSKYIRFWLFLIAGFIPTLVAAGRGETVGTDITTYVKPLQAIANVSQGFNEYKQIVSTVISERLESGYLFLIYISSRFTQKLYLNFFITELIIMSCLIIGMVNFNKIRKISFALGLFIFFGFFYNMSFNMIRQSIAIFIIFCGFSYLAENRWIIYVLFVAAAYLFHSSAIIGLLFLLIYWFLYRKDKSHFNFSWGTHIISTQGKRTIILSSILPILLVFRPLIKNLLRLLGQSLYAEYISSNLQFSLSQILIRLPFLIVILLEWNDNRENKYRYFYLVVCVLDLCLSQLSGNNDGFYANFGARIAWYTTMFYIYSMSDMLNVVRNNKAVILKIFVCVSICMYWYDYIVVLNYNETIPYIFSWFK